MSPCANEPSYPWVGASLIGRDHQCIHLAAKSLPFASRASPTISPVLLIARTYALGPPAKSLSRWITPLLYSQPPMTSAFTPMVTWPPALTPVADSGSKGALIPKSPRS